MRSSIVFVIVVFFSGAAFADTPQDNTELVTRFYSEVLFHGRADAIDDYIGDTYIQHNPNLPDGKEALRALVKSMGERDQPSGEIIRAIAEDDLVVLHVHNFGWPAPNGGAIVDIFRVDNGMIVEHWDVIQAIPESSQNDNTMF